MSRARGPRKNRLFPAFSSFSQGGGAAAGCRRAPRRGSSRGLVARRHACGGTTDHSNRPYGGAFTRFFASPWPSQRAGAHRQQPRRAGHVSRELCRHWSPPRSDRLLGAQRRSHSLLHIRVQQNLQGRWDRVSDYSSFCLRSLYTTFLGESGRSVGAVLSRDVLRLRSSRGLSPPRPHGPVTTAAGEADPSGC